jgi:thiosulfate reductase electron transport protein
MSNFVILHDEFRCIGCQSCTAACANLNDINAGFARVQVQIRLHEDGRYLFSRVSCRHCAEAPCVKACPTGATYKDNDGITQVEPKLCISCGYCVGACPYKVRFVDPVKKASDKCDFCTVSRLAKGERPACVGVCPTDALEFGRLDSAEVQNWLKSHPFVYQDEKPGTGKLSLYRNKEVHPEVEK